MPSVRQRLTIFPSPPDGIWLAHEPVTQHLLAWDGDALWQFFSVSDDEAESAASLLTDRRAADIAMINGLVGGRRLTGKWDYPIWPDVLQAAVRQLNAAGIRLSPRQLSISISSALRMTDAQLRRLLERDEDCSGLESSGHRLFLVPIGPERNQPCARIYHFDPARRAVVPPDPVWLYPAGR